MQEAADAAESGMVSVIGLDSDTVAKLCDAANEQVGGNTLTVANYLCPGNYVVSGSKEVRHSKLTAAGFCRQEKKGLAAAVAFHAQQVLDCQDGQLLDIAPAHSQRRL